MDGVRKEYNSYRGGKRGPRRSSYQRGGRYNYYSRDRDYSYNESYSRSTYENGRTRAKPSTKHSNKYNKRKSSRAASPIEGSEEYMARKIQQTSAIIMRQLLSPDEAPTPQSMSSRPIKDNGAAIVEDNTITKEGSHQLGGSVGDKSLNKSKKNPSMNLSAKEIHEKIMNHITNLNNGRKKNFINANSSTGLDNAINHMQKQKRLEISRILRDMGSVMAQLESDGHTNSIVPDIGIKIEELPIDVIEELRQTLNLDLEYLNEAIADSSNFINCEETITESSEEVNEAIASIQVKEERVDSLLNVQNNDGGADAVEIKAEDISDVFEERAETSSCLLQERTETPSCLVEERTETSCLLEERKVISVASETSSDLLADALSENVPESDCNLEIVREPMDHSIWIKEEVEQAVKSPYPEETSVCSESTVFFGKNDTTLQNKNDCDLDNRTVESHVNIIEGMDLDSNSSLRNLEETIRQFIDKDRQLQCSRVDSALQKLDLIELCVRHLTNYRRCLTQSIVTLCNRNSLTEKGEESTQMSQKSKCETLVTRSSQTISSGICDEDRHFAKRRKIEVTPKVNNYENQSVQMEEIKEETNDVLEVDAILNFPEIQEKIVAIEKVNNELLLATESGNIMFMSLKDGSLLQCLDVTSCIITSMTFVRGINDFIYMYVGSLEEVLRIYDFRKRHMLKAKRIDDQIRCMDSMWDYVFMGCKNGTLIRYSCKKEKIEFVEKTPGADILVLKAIQEGPRRVLLVGHRQAPIFVRDAFSGLYLRNFSNQAITPTVYSIVIDQSKLYCGTANHNILVFSFHEGAPLEKMVADDSKGISCMKTYKNLLFAGCFNGSIYVYNLNLKKRITILKGPGGGILCMAILSKQVIVGTITSKFHAVSLPSDLYSDV